MVLMCPSKFSKSNRNSCSNSLGILEKVSPNLPRKKGAERILIVYCPLLLLDVSRTTEKPKGFSELLTKCDIFTMGETMVEQFKECLM
jgi:hypothetical protein